MTEKQQPGTKARLIREALERHPDLAPHELASLLNDQHKTLEIEFHSADISLAKHILGHHPKKGGHSGAGHCSPLFSDHIPPMRERENPALQGFLTSNQEEGKGAAGILTTDEERLLRELVRKAGSVRRLIQVLETLDMV
jgi:hypothetical protein